MVGSVPEVAEGCERIRRFRFSHARGHWFESGTARHLAPFRSPPVGFSQAACDTLGGLSDAMASGH